ncbi:kinetochore protein spc7 [Aspergillus udagawae]|nr:kinetochore protein spc7 [Aspergillus udagawae]
MASRGDSAGSGRPRSRRSIAHVPRLRLTSGIDKENATTDIGAVQSQDGFAKRAGKDKKSRSKSLGPGGLDALQDSNGNRRKSTMAFPLKSILKPTIPVSPVRNIPSFEETRKQTPARGAQQDGVQADSNDQGKEDLLVDIDTPAQPPVSGPEDPANPFDTFNASSAIAAAREQEEKERRERERQIILEKREARRKSMANRRVSFAPEATLHTWNVVEIPDDSTSSSASNSTRRASSLAENQAPTQASNQREPPSTPDTVAESDIAFSPVEYPDLQELKNRSTSVYDEPSTSQDLSSSPFSGGSADGLEDTGIQDVAREDDDDDDDDSSSGSGFDGESTAMSMDDLSVHSAASVRSDRSGSSTSSSARLNEALRQAAKEAGTRGIDYDEDGEMSMEIADQEITGAFQPWIKKGQRQSFEWEDISALHDQENTNPSHASIQSSTVPDGSSHIADEDLSMEVTNAIGRIIQPSRRQSTVRRKSTSEETDYDEQTMEFTNVIGGIKQSTSPTRSAGGESNASDEEMTMEFTSVVGGVLNKPFQAQHAEEANTTGWNSEDDGGSMEDDADMEMTGAVGGILSATGTRDGQDADQTAGMELTTAMGRILPTAIEAVDDNQERGDTNSESENEQPGSSPFQENVRQSPSKSPVSFHLAAVASESGSPSLASVRPRSTRQSLSRRMSNTPSAHSPHQSPVKNTLTSPKDSTPQAGQSMTPSKTPLSTTNNRSASPKKLFQPETRRSASKDKSPGCKSLFGSTAVTGEAVPLFVLRPHEKRRSSGLGIDKEGLGSPRVAAMLDERRSIGEEAPRFVPQEQPKSGVRFEDPLKLQEEVDMEREEEEKREDGHIPPLQLDPTANLKDMISSLTPKKNKLRGRKSLHVGAARGLLGKRPVELDQDDEEDADNTPKRLKGRNASPVKSIKLPAPPTKDETVGHLKRSPARKSAIAPPIEGSTTPSQELKTSSLLLTPAKDVPETFNSSTESTSAEEGNVASQDSEPEFEPIQLQDFLNMTNIHFMELTTTKRRHTTAPGSASKRTARLSAESKAATASFEDCVAAGFCTVPMLELYQHSCRELKSYISEGRQVIRSIEAETYAENPPLFREYATAPPDIRLLMDNQFRNVKTHARLMSKATWYEWRMKLLEGLKEGLYRHVDEMKTDGNLLTKYETLLDGVVPSLVDKQFALQEEAANLQQLADEMESCDQDELRNAREKLSSLEDEIELKKKQLQELQGQVKEKTSSLESGAKLKAEFLAQIQEAERVKEECHGWSAKEISELKESVRKIEHQTGWSIVSATSSGSPAGPLLTMSYREQLQLVFHPATFAIENAAQRPSSIDEKTTQHLELKYHPIDGGKSTIQAPQLSPIALLVLKSLQKHLRTLQPNTATINPKHLLRFISNAWNSVLNLEEEARMLEFCGVTKLRLSEDEDKLSLRARCTLLGADTAENRKTPASKSTKKHASNGKRRIDVDFAVRTRIVQGNESRDVGSLGFETDVIASKVYGFGSGNDLGMSETEMRTILCKEMGEKTAGVQLGSGVWSKAVRMLTGTVF